jgi:putative uncharacterized protein (fragment)
MKKIILAGLLLAVGSVAMADSAQDVLKKARDDYYKQQEAERKAAKAPKKVERVKVETSEGAEEYEALEAEEEVEPRTPMERLEYNANKAAIKVDFYERVVRSVAREEKELDGYNEVLGKKKNKKVKQQKSKTEKTKKTKK